METRETRKKKVAVFVNGWNAENIQRYLTGLSEKTPEDTIDYYVFVSYGIYSSTDVELKSLCAIYDLPNLKTFDAAIMFVPGLNFTEVINHLLERLENSGIPVIIIGMQHPGFYYIGINNYTGMRQLCDHIIEEHGARDIMFIAGSRENEDSNNRLIALKDSLYAHGLTFSDSNVYYSNWEVGQILYEFADRIRRGDKLPDAFVCANDQLAETISYVLSDNGVPMDRVIVTGFDYTEESQSFYPSIATVDQCYNEVGEKTVEVLTAIFEGREAPKELLVNCRFRPGESCGCINCRNDDERRRMLGRNNPRKSMIFDVTDGRFHAMENDIIQAADYEDMKAKLRRLYHFSNGQEGDTFYIMLDPHIVDFSLTELVEHPKYRFSDVMDTIVAKRDSKPIEAGVIPTSQLFPDDASTGKNRVYFFIPIFYESFVCGYIAIADRINWIPEKYFQQCQNRFNRALVSYRRNMQLTALNAKLSMLMEKDSLTFVKNRTAYDRYVKQLESTMLSGEFDPFAVVCFDINYLKQVNDALGHEAGDEYIRKCCKLICNTFKHSPVFRIGGDEFIAIAVHDDYTQRYELLSGMRDRMAELDANPDISPIDRLSVASGMADCFEHMGDDYSAIFRRADVRMYENKRQMKGED